MSATDGSDSLFLLGLAQKQVSTPDFNCILVLERPNRRHSEQIRFVTVATYYLPKLAVDHLNHPEPLLELVIKTLRLTSCQFLFPATAGQGVDEVSGATDLVKN